MDTVQEEIQIFSESQRTITKMCTRETIELLKNVSKVQINLQKLVYK